MWNVALFPLILLAASAVASAADWVPVRKVEGVQVEALATPSGFKIHRAEVFLCTEIAYLTAFISDTSRFHEWIPNLQQVRLLDASANSVTYYMKSAAPWPLRPRDMIYQLTDLKVLGNTSELGIGVKGLPAYLPENDGAYRMREVTGEWRIVGEDEGLRVTHQLYVDPGRVPQFFANRRMSTSLAETLSNLARQFPCPSEP